METSKKIILAGLAAFFSLAVIGLPASWAQTTNHAGIVVQLGDGSISTACVSFEADQITGYDLLQASGLSVEASFDAMGAAVCSINGTGCSADDCFCSFPPDYWSYWQMSGGSWAYSNLGASSSTVTNGEVEGWSWGSGSPPAVSQAFEEICASALTQPTATQETILLPTETSTLIPPTMTPEPSLTNTPEPTLTFTITPTQVILLPTATVASTATNTPTSTPIVAAAVPNQALTTPNTPPSVPQAILTVSTSTLAPVSNLPGSPAEVENQHNEATISPVRLMETGQPGSQSPANNLLGISGFFILAGGLMGILAFRMANRR